MVLRIECHPADVVSATSTQGSQSLRSIGLSLGSWDPFFMIVLTHYITRIYSSITLPSNSGTFRQKVFSKSMLQIWAVAGGTFKTSHLAKLTRNIIEELLMYDAYYKCIRGMIRFWAQGNIHAANVCNQYWIEKIDCHSKYIVSITCVWP